MSSIAATTTHVDNSFEQWLFEKSPVGTVATAVGLYVILAGGFVLIVLAIHAPLLDSASREMHLAHYLWSALVLSLLTATVLGMQRYAHMREMEDEAAFAAIAPQSSVVMTILQPASRSRMLAANVTGAVAGIGLAYVTAPATYPVQYPALFAWNVAIMMFLSALFMRGVVMTAQGGRAFSHLIEHELRIDLLHVDKLAVIGRRSARNALIWFTVAAITCLFFIGGEVDSSVIVLLFACAGMGLWIFLQPMEHVHRRIHAEKTHALDQIRDEIGHIREEAKHDAAAATRLQGLLAYEARIQAVHEWPFDQSTLVRVAAYVLIPAIPWFGEAFVSNLIQKLAH